MIRLFTAIAIPPEIGQGLIELRGAARDPGLRAKISVQAKDRRRGGGRFFIISILATATPEIRVQRLCDLFKSMNII